jgi:uncharacterized protein YciI
MRILHIYTMRAEPDRIRAVAPEHAAYWRGLELAGYLGGPFGDRSGGLITFEADSIEDAVPLIEADPFVREGLVEESWVRQWLTE